MRIDLHVAAAGLLVGFTVGLTGIGGGALMTPLLVLVFKVQPLAAISSDLVAAVIMKPVGGGVHLRRGSVNFALVRWLTVGSVPAAFAGVLVLRHLGDGAVVQARITQALGVALLLAASSIAAKALLQTRRAALGMAGGESAAARPFRLRPLPTVLIGVVGGLVVGMTSVGSGSLMIMLLLVLYPMLRSSELVGTDLVQAIPLIASAAVGGDRRHPASGAGLARRPGESAHGGRGAAGRCPLGIGLPAGLAYFGLLRPRLVAAVQTGLAPAKP